MKRLRWLLVLVVLLGSMGGVAAWLFAHQGYPYVVYYRLSTVDGDQGTGVLDEWIDPQGQRLLRRYHLQAGRMVWTLAIPGWLYWTGNDGLLHREPDWQSQDAYLPDLFVGLRADGFTGIGQRLLAKHIGTVERETTDGHAALCIYPANDNSFSVLCVDAHHLVPLSFAARGVGSAHYTNNRRIAPYSLPANFFDLPNTRQSLWDWVTSWAQDHLPRQR